MEVIIETCLPLLHTFKSRFVPLFEMKKLKLWFRIFLAGSITVALTIEFVTYDFIQGI